MGCSKRQSVWAMAIWSVVLFATQAATQTAATTGLLTSPTTVPVVTTQVSTTQPVVTKLPVPSAEELAPLNRQIDEVLKHAMADTTPAGRQQLGRKLMKLADEAQSPEEEFALLDKARTAAASAGDATTAIDANDRIISKYVVDAAAYRTFIVTGLSKSVTSTLDCSLTVQLGFSAVDDAVDAGDYGRASKLLNFIAPVVERPRVADLLPTFREKSKMVHDLTADANGLAAALAVLKKHLNDPASNLVAGRFYCTAKNDWPKGLGYLTKCADAKLKTLALQEVDEPPSAGDPAKREIKLADAWWDYADKQTVMDRGAIKKHAEVLYLAAKPGLTGLAAMHVQQRLEATPHFRINLLTLIDLKRDTVQGSFSMDKGVLYSDGKGQDKIEFKYEPPEEYDVEMEYSRLEGDSSVIQMLSKNQQPFIWELGSNRGTEFTFKYMKNVNIWNNKTTGALSEPMENGVKYKSLVQVRNDGVKGFIDGRLISQWKTDYSDIDPTQPWWLIPHRAFLGIGTNNSKTAIYSADAIPFRRDAAEGEK